MTSTIVAETAALTIARFSIFFSCRKYLLHIFYSDLHSLSLSSPSSSVPGTPGDATTSINTHSNNELEESIQLDSLPLPSTAHTPRSPHFTLEDPTYLHAAVSRIMFSWCFTESCMMFFLLMLQAFGIFSATTRLLNWQFSLFLILLSILVIIPFAISLFLTIGNPDHRREFQRPIVKTRVFLSLVPVIIYFFALSHIPLPAALASSDTTTIALSRLIVLGTIILGLLSGFGVISNSWRFLPFISQPRGVPSEQELDAAQYSLTSIRNDMRSRKKEAARREGSTAETTSWFSRVGSSFRGGDSLTQELQALQVLEHDMTLNLENLRELRSAAQYSRTFRGRIFNFGQRIFAIYCMIKVVSSIYNVFFRPSQSSSTIKSYPDLITNLLSYLLSLRISNIYSSPTAIDVNADPDAVKLKSDYDFEDLASKLARQLSMIFIGIIILSSIRVVLRGVTKVLRVSSRTLAASLMLLVLAQIMGIYFLSTIVQMRASFPPPPSMVSVAPLDSPSMPTTTTMTTTTTNLFSTIPAYEVFGSLFDWTFLISAGGSLVINYVRWGVQG